MVGLRTGRGGVTCEVWWGLRTCMGGGEGPVRCGGALGQGGGTLRY